MSDYEDEYFQEEVDDIDDYEYAVSHLRVTIKNGGVRRNVSVLVKYYDERDAIGADHDRYMNDMNIISPFLSRLHPGWLIEEIVLEDVLTNSRFDLDATMNE